MTLSKISVGAIWFCGVGYLVLRNYLPRIKADLRHAGLLMAMLAVIVVVIGLAFLVIPTGGASLSTAGFGFWRQYTPVAVVNTEVIALAALVIALRLWQRGFDLPTELLGLIMLVAWSAAMAVNFDSGSSYYFLSVGTWVAITILARALLLRLDADSASIS